MEDDSKVCLICGVDSNKKAKHDRYNHLPPIQKKKQGKGSAKGVDSDLDSPDTGKRGSRRTPQASPAASRQTRNQNPKSFAASMCKAMDLPATPKYPFLAIFSGADYCPDCMTRVKDIHANQTELEKVQQKISEARVDIELDLSKHLQKIPFCKTVLRVSTYERYKEDINLILDFHDPEKKAKRDAEEAQEEEEEPSITSALKLKRKADANGAGQTNKAKITKIDVKAEPDANMNDKNDEDMSTESIPDTPVNGIEVKSEVSDANDIEPPVDIKYEDEPKVKKVVREKVKKDPNLKCPHCSIPRYFNIPQSLEDHINKVHNRPFACDACDRKFQTERELTNHKAKHEGADIYVCGFCDKPFKQKRYLEDHLDEHPQAKPLNCQYCGKTFGRKESLQKGFQIYKGQPVDPCGRCSRSLNLKDHLEHNRQLKDK